MSNSHKLLVSPSPHLHSGDTIERNMYDVVIALLPAFAVSFYYFGWDSFWVTLTSILACLLFEWLISCFLMGRKELTILDGSAIVTGLLLALNLPSTASAMDCGDRCVGSYRYRQDVIWRFGQQHLQPRHRGSCDATHLFPSTDDQLPKTL